MDDLLEERLKKARELRERGVELYPHRWERAHTAAQALAKGEGLQPMERVDGEVRVAGRLVQIREMGKASFAHIQDGSAKLQLYLKKDLLGEAAYDVFKKGLHLGDFVGVCGQVFKTKTGETTVEAKTLTVLAKSLRPIPEKWHGLTDTDTRYRHRHLDLIANAEAREIFRARSAIVASVRKTFGELGFLEVETPILLHQAGGASARPFNTHHNALDADLVLRIATELYLKKLIIGGFERVYEIGRIFRNEGTSPRHNPEFTSLELYQAYGDYNDLMNMTEEMLRTVINRVCGATT
ncbi:MAG TPA: amino acid--tRNA ligase-related protein, partial [Elusimicrobiota bacterium]|nr:amino acid--tRNA ligase-related protein [Elusimicrobiota bacterium]